MPIFGAVAGLTLGKIAVEASTSAIIAWVAGGSAGTIVVGGGGYWIWNRNNETTPTSEESSAVVIGKQIGLLLGDEEGTKKIKARKAIYKKQLNVVNEASTKNALLLTKLTVSNNEKHSENKKLIAENKRLIAENNSLKNTVMEQNDQISELSTITNRVLESLAGQEQSPEATDETQSADHTPSFFKGAS
tara:strand:+ start:274 stop:843 length:570 start_codon:yes stop_codon:yes gene_type:complete